VPVVANNDNDTYVNGQVGFAYKQSISLGRASSSTEEWKT